MNLIAVWMKNTGVIIDKCVDKEKSVMVHFAKENLKQKEFAASERWIFKPIAEGHNKNFEELSNMYLSN